MLIHGHFSPAVPFFFLPSELVRRPRVCSESLGALSLQLESDSSPRLQERQQLKQESLRGLYDLVTPVDRLKVMESI